MVDAGDCATTSSVFVHFSRRSHPRYRYCTCLRNTSGFTSSRIFQNSALNGL